MEIRPKTILDSPVISGVDSTEPASAGPAVTEEPAVDESPTEPREQASPGKVMEAQIGSLQQKAAVYAKLGIKPEDVREVADRGGDDPALLAHPKNPESANAKLNRRLDASKQTIQDTKDAKASYEAGRDALDVTQGARNLAKGKLESVDKAVGAFRSNLAGASEELDKILQSARGATQEMATGKMSIGDYRKTIADLNTKQAKVLEKLKGCDKLAGEFQQAVRAGGKLNQGVTNVSEMAQELKACRGKAGKALFALDAACNFADLQARDPNNTEKNVKQAITMSGAKFFADLKTAGSAANMVETAVGVMKFGMWSLGMSDTPAGKSLDAVASVLPIEMFSKNMGMLTDINETIKKDLMSGGGALKDWERINSDNLAGNNGPWVQTGAMVGDMIATGGQNLPRKDMYGLADSLGIYGASENIPDAFKNANPNAKALAVGELMDSNAGNVTQHAANENSLKMREMLTYGPPAQSVDVLKRIDKGKLVNNLTGDVRPGVMSKNADASKANLPTQGNLNQVSGLVVDLIHKANAPLTPPEVRTELMNQAAQIVHAADQNGKFTATGQLQELLAQNKLGNIPNSLRTVIREAGNWQR